MTTPLFAWAALASRVPPVTMQAARSRAALHLRRMECEHGRTAACKILAAGLATASPPLPTEDAAMLAPLAAAAEMLLR